MDAAPSVIRDLVVIDENIITAKGMGVSIPFGLALVSILCGEETAEKLKNAVIA